MKAAQAIGSGPLFTSGLRQVTLPVYLPVSGSTLRPVGSEKCREPLPATGLKALDVGWPLPSVPFVRELLIAGPRLQAFLARTRR